MTTSLLELRRVLLRHYRYTKLNSFFSWTTSTDSTAIPTTLNDGALCGQEPVLLGMKVRILECLDTKCLMTESALQ